MCLNSFVHHKNVINYFYFNDLDFRFNSKHAVTLLKISIGDAFEVGYFCIIESPVYGYFSC